MELFIALGTFVAVTLAVYGVMYRSSANPAMDARLGGLRYTRAGRENIPDPDAAFRVRVVDPIARAMSERFVALLPGTLSVKVEAALDSAGIKMKPGQFIAMVGVLMGTFSILGATYMAVTGQGLLYTVGAFFGGLALGVFVPRFLVLKRIAARQKAIWRSLPDAFDLITASVEAGLGVDAAFSRVIEKVEGPFAEELTRTMREISMGRSRREAFTDMAERTGVDELRSLINAVVQAEAMGISIGSVIRVQTGVIRTKRRQRAEEQAFKAPVKMVFPLVFFIFPAIMIVIGGPAVIQLMDGLGG